MSVIHIKSTKIIEFDYVNYKGEASLRKVLPQQLEYGTTPYHKEPQFLLRAFDLVKEVERTFAIKDMSNVRYEK